VWDRRLRQSDFLTGPTGHRRAALSNPATGSWPPPNVPCSHADRPLTTASKTIRGGRTSWTGSMDMPQVRLGPGRFGGPGAVLTGPSVRSQGVHHQPGLPPCPRGPPTPAAPRASENRPRHVGPPCACPGRFRHLGMGPPARRAPISGLAPRCPVRGPHVRERTDAHLLPSVPPRPARRVGSE